jgi:predicted outer membrane protein
MTGADFDRAYIKMMLSDHKKDVSEFEKQSTKGADADIKAFAGTTLPTLQEHLTMIQALSGTTEAGTVTATVTMAARKTVTGTATRIVRKSWLLLVR